MEVGFYKAGHTEKEVNRILKMLNRSRNKDYMTAADKMLQSNAYTIPPFGVIEYSSDILWDEERSRGYLRLLHGHTFLGCLVDAYCNTGKSEYLLKGMDIIKDWIEKHPYEKKKQTMAYHDETTALRLNYWLLFYIYAKEKLPADDMNLLEKSMRQTAELLAADDFHATGTNHGMFQDIALLLFSTYFSLENDKALAYKRLLEYFHCIFTSDGVHKEHSPAYHFMIVGHVKKLFSWVEEIDERYKNDFLTILKKSEKFSIHIFYPNGMLPPVCDTEMKELTGYSCHLYDKEEFQYARTGGKMGVAPEENDLVLLDAGYAIFRDDWKKKEHAAYVMFSAAYHVDYHKHSDDLNVLIYKDGEIVTEAGPNGYNYKDSFTQYAYSSFAHNTLIVDGEGLVRTDQQYDRVGMVDYQLNEEYAEATGINKRYQGIEHKRKVTFRKKEERVEVSDWIKAEKSHSYKLLWHLASNITACAQDKMIELFRDNKKVMEIEFLTDISPEIHIYKGQVSPSVQGWKFPKMEEKEEAEVIEVGISGSNVKVETIFRLSNFKIREEIENKESSMTVIPFDEEWRYPKSRKALFTFVNGGLELGLKFSELESCHLIYGDDANFNIAPKSERFILTKTYAVIIFKLIYEKYPHQTLEFIFIGYDRDGNRIQNVKSFHREIHIFPDKSLYSFKIALKITNPGIVFLENIVTNINCSRNEDLSRESLGFLKHNSQYIPYREKNYRIDELKEIATQMKLGKFSVSRGRAACDIDFDVFDWKNYPRNENNFKFRLHSLEIVSQIGQYYHLTNDNHTDLYEIGVKIITKWYENNPITDYQNNAWGYYDQGTALRVLYTLEFITEYMKSSCVNKEFLGMYHNMLIETGFLLLQDDFYVEKDNHGIFQDLALLSISLYLKDFYLAKEWTHVALKRLEVQLLDTISTEGVHLEHSPIYHWYVWDLLRRTDNWLKSNGIEVSMFKASMDKMMDYFVYALKPDLSLPLFGDSIAKKFSLQSFENKVSSDLSYLLTKGESGSKPSHLNKVYAESGYAFFRNRWDGEEQVYFAFTANFNSLVHKHPDNLSFEIFAYGEDVMMDSGHYSYNRCEEREHMLSGLAHNVVLVNGKGVEISKENIGKSGILKYHEYENEVVLDTFNFAFAELKQFRTIYYNRDNTFIIKDVISNEGDIINQYHQSFNLAPHFRLYDQKENRVVFINDKKTILVTLELIYTNSHASTQFKKGMISRFNNSAIENPIVQYQIEGKDAVFITKITVEKRMNRGSAG